MTNQPLIKLSSRGKLKTVKVRQFLIGVYPDRWTDSIRGKVNGSLFSPPELPEFALLPKSCIERDGLSGNG